ncbi:MAG: hypothetical protein WCK51_12435 [Armatimonadota bacterium]
MITAICVLTLLAPKVVPTILVLNKAENTVWLIDEKSGKPRAKLPTGPNPNEVMVSPDQKTATISDMGGGPGGPGKTLTFVDIEKGEIKKTVNIEPNGAPHGIQWLSNDRLVFTSHVSDSINEFDVPSGKVLRTMPTQQKGTHLVVFGNDNKNAFAVNAFSGTITAFDFSAGKITKQIVAGNRAEGISISPDGSYIACANVGGNDTSIIDTRSLEVIHTIKDTPAAIRTIFTADGKRLAISCVGSGVVEVFDTTKWTKTATVELKQRPIANKDYGNQWPAPMNFWRRKNGNLLVVLVTSHAIAEISSKTWKVVKTYDTGGIPDGMCMAE